jgi:hypothetical protein
MVFGFFLVGGSTRREVLEDDTAHRGFTVKKGVLKGNRTPWYKYYFVANTSAS